MDKTKILRQWYCLRRWELKSSQIRPCTKCVLVEKFPSISKSFGQIKLLLLYTIWANLTLKHWIICDCYEFKSTFSYILFKLYCTCQWRHICTTTKLYKQNKLKHANYWKVLFKQVTNTMRKNKFSIHCCSFCKTNIHTLIDTHNIANTVLFCHSSLSYSYYKMCAYDNIMAFAKCLVNQ